MTTRQRPGGAPFMNSLPQSVIDRYEREQGQRTASAEEPEGESEDASDEQN